MIRIQVGTRKRTRVGREELGTIGGRMFFAWFDASGGGNPYDRDGGDEAKRQARMLEGERDRDEIDEQGKIVFALDGSVLGFEFARVAQSAADGQAEEKEAEAGH